MTTQDPAEKRERPLPAAWTDNPFQPPAAHVDDLRWAGDGRMLGEPRRLDTGRGSAWWNEGWGVFREATGLWIGMSVAMIVIFVVLGMLPIVGGLATYVLAPVLSGGLMLGCRSLDVGEQIGFGHLFAGFQKNLGQLALVGLLYLAGAVAIGVGIFVVILGGGVGAVLSGGELPVGAASSTILMAVLLGAVLGIPLAMAIWFAPALVMLNEVSAVSAMKLSFAGCLRNTLPFLVYGLIGLVLAIVATVALGLGWLVLIPLMVCSTYVAYKEIFIA